MKVDSPIGIIDSGAGGLTVVKEMLHRLPQEPIIYIGDTARCPYGPRPAEEVKNFTKEMVSKLSDMGIKMLIIACNTATAVALEEIRSQFSFPVVGVIVPGARAAVQASNLGNIAVLGTAGTINSGAYEDAIRDISTNSTIHPLACPDFVPVVESGQYHSEYASEVVKRTLLPLADVSFDAAILGCTHYPLLQEHIAKHLPEGVRIISSAVETIRDVEGILHEKKLARQSDQPVEPVFYSTGGADAFRLIVQDWLTIEEPDVRHIML
ncbi:glutamate racemase [Sporosarcina sp. 179-K 3D1 HS]|uniref:glutamate racemase n=1 Tax=Sporosarcina sp. 179-K 3D1 HS TaxID=3232169 RepID=UPI0039A23D9E